MLIRQYRHLKLALSQHDGISIHMLTLPQLSGQDDSHLVMVGEFHRLQPQAANAFKAMQLAAKEDGIDLQIASSFRDFYRQQAIWNDKFNGIRSLLDHQGQPIEITTFNEEQLCLAILRWSAMPGASRHHWGSDFDVFSPSMIPEEYKVQLTPEEFGPSGYFARLTTWLDNNMERFDFYRPFNADVNGVAPELWHLSYRPLAKEIEKQLTPEAIALVWHNQDIAGKSWLLTNINMIFERFIVANADKP